MIKPEIEKIYDILLSIFLGVILMLFFNKMYDSPRIILIYKDN